MQQTNLQTRPCTIEELYRAPLLPYPPTAPGRAKVVPLPPPPPSAAVSTAAKAPGPALVNPPIKAKEPGSNNPKIIFICLCGAAALIGLGLYSYHLYKKDKRDSGH